MLTVFKGTNTARSHTLKLADFDLHADHKFAATVDPPRRSRSFDLPGHSHFRQTSPPWRSSIGRHNQITPTENVGPSPSKRLVRCTIASGRKNVLHRGLILTYATLGFS